MSQISLPETSPEYWLRRITENMGSKPYEDQIKMVRAAENHLFSLNKAIILQAPCGSGKTAVIVSVALAAIKRDFRVLILSPTYSHIESVIGEPLEYANFPDAPTRWPIFYSYSRPEMTNICPKDENQKSGRKLCRLAYKDCQNSDCKVEKIIKECRESNLVLATHAKLVYDPDLLKPRGSPIGKFDVILIDESHNFPDEITNYRIKKYSKDSFLETLKKHSLQDSFEEFKDLWDELSVDPKNRSIYREFYKELSYLEDNQNLPNKIRLLIQMKKTKDSKFKINSSGFTVIKKAPELKFKRMSLGLFTATLEESSGFMNDCCFKGVSLAYENYFEAEHVINRYKRISIFCFQDSVELKLNGDTYSTARSVANDIIVKILNQIDKHKSDQFTALILCRNEKDASSIIDELENQVKLKNKIFDLSPVEKQLQLVEDSIADKLVETINAEVKKGKNIIIATASSRLWEGANIEGLRVLIIDSLPYRPLLETDGRLVGYFGSHPIFRHMTRRLQQGIGRLGRQDWIDNENTRREWGIAFIIDKRFITQSERYFWRKGMERLPNYMKTSILQMPRSYIPRVINRSLNMFQNTNEILRRKLSLDDYFEGD